MDQQTTPLPPPISPVGTTKRPRKFATWMLLAICAVVVTAAVIVGLLVLKVPLFGKLGVDVAYTEGTVQYRLASDKSWQDAPADLSLSEGAEVRTMADSRAILNIDDGSAIRLNANSSVLLKELSTSRIVVQNTGGDVYTRVVKSEKRVFEVTTGEATYRSEGTGYRTVKTDTREGVEVYHSKVTILGLNTDGDVLVSQGERYYIVDRENPDAAGKVTELSPEQVAADSFMQWNSEEDKKDFSNELGVLFDLVPPALEISTPAAGLTTDSDAVTVKGTTEAGAKVLVNGTDTANNDGAFVQAVALSIGENSIKVEAVDGAGNKTVKTIAVTRNAPPAPAPAPKTSFTLYGTKVDKGISFSWNISGITVSKGFKLVKSTSANPTYPGSDAQFLEASARSYTWKIKDGQTYNFRICVYDGSGCTAYSNNIKVTAPYVASTEEQPSGTLTLSGTTANVSWVLNGSAPNGLKLVWSLGTGPTYPGSHAAFYDKTATSGTISGDPGQYYVRICMYVNGGCTNYSNEILVTIP